MHFFLSLGLKANTGEADTPGQSNWNDLRQEPEHEKTEQPESVGEVDNTLTGKINQKEKAKFVRNFTDSPPSRHIILAR